MTFQGLPGITASASPDNFTIEAGNTQNLDITFTRAGAALNTYQAGFMTLTSSNHVVRSPVVIRPVALQAPLEVALNGSNAASWSIKSGVGPETLTLGKRGLIAASTDAVSLSDDAGNTFDTANPDSNLDGSTFKESIVVPAGQSVLRFSTFDADTDGNDDLDVYLYRGTMLIATSLGPTSEEVVTVRNPLADNVPRVRARIRGGGWQREPHVVPWLLAPVDALNMTVNRPFAATIGSSHTVNVTTSGLTAGTRYLGQITYTGSVAGPIGTPTIVSGKAS